MSKYRDVIKKIAIVDFDVHHGNGTEDIVKNLQKNIYDLTFGNENLEGGLTLSLKKIICKPWLDFDDSDNVLFVSLHAYDVDNPEYFYPSSGSGQTNTIRGSKPYPAGILNIPILGENKYSPEYKQIFLNRVIPRLHKFKPDLILISAGFDGHELEEMNMNYMKLNENDYRLITEELTKIANKYSEGRIVSVLEGGYNIDSGIVSSFAQSVMTHTKFLNIGLNKFYYDINNNDELNENSNLNSMNIARYKAKRKKEYFQDQANYRKIKKMKIEKISTSNDDQNLNKNGSIEGINIDEVTKTVNHIDETIKNSIEFNKFNNESYINSIPKKLIKKKNKIIEENNQIEEKPQEMFLKNDYNFIHRENLTLRSDINIYNLDNMYSSYNHNLNLIENLNSKNFIDSTENKKHNLEDEVNEALHFNKINQITINDKTNHIDNIINEDIEKYINLNNNQNKENYQENNEKVIKFKNNNLGGTDSEIINNDNSQEEELLVEFEDE